MKLSGVAILTVAAALVVSGAGTSIRAEWTRNPAFATGPDVLRAQILSDVMAAIDKNRSSKTFFEYDTSGYAARDVFSNVKALRNPAGWEALCQSMETLAPEPLALFDLAIAEASAEKTLPCAPVLQARLSAYWRENKIRLEQHLATLPPPKKTKGASGRSKFRVEERRIPVRKAATIRGALKPNEIALTFSNGPHPTRTQRILEILKSSGARAHFFHIGKKIRQYNEVDHRVVEEKNTLGSSGFSSRPIDRLPLVKAEKEILDGRQAAEAASGADIPFFRFPYGITTPELKEILKQNKMPNILWNMDSLDWQIRDVSVLFDRIIQVLEKNKGGTLLMHDVYEQTVLVLPALLDELKARGFTVVVFVPEE